MSERVPKRSGTAKDKNAMTMQLRSKLTLGFGITLTLLAVIAAVGIIRLSAVDANLESISVSVKKAAVANRVIDMTNTIQLAIRNIVVSEDMSFKEKEKAILNQSRSTLIENFDLLAGMLATKEETDLFTTMKEAIAAGREANNKALSLGMENKTQEAAKVLSEQGDALIKKAVEKVENLVNYEEKSASTMVEKARKESGFSRKFMLFLGLFAILLGIPFVFFITRSITKPIRRVVEGLSLGGDQVASASAQIASSSQQLAEGASEQAAAIEETSSSLEEMASMVKQNSENAERCRVVMEESNQIVGNVDKHISGMTEAIGKIQSSSEQTVKIIKTIDEIAFQTNLLALNAAVEAARAGEAGAGFAVVADEVRNLALRAAEAAKTTSAMIEDTVKAVKDGSELTKLTQEAFQKNLEIARKVAELVGEIAAASKEQAQGIDQINKGVAEMDKVTQQNSASAEETASASEEMNAQAEQMKEFVAGLVALVGGTGKGTKKKQPGHRGRGHVRANVPPAPAGKIAASSHKGNGKANGSAITVPKGAGRVSPEQIIPLGDENFSDF